MSRQRKNVRSGKCGSLTWAVTADPQLLASAVTNLLNNAFKYTAPGGRVVLRATANDEGTC